MSPNSAPLPSGPLRLGFPLGNFRSQFRAFSRPRLDSETTIEKPDPFFHAHETQAPEIRGTSDFEALAIVRDSQFKAVLVSHQLDADLFGLRVLPAVAEAFLSDAV